MENEYVIEMLNITKEFPGIKANDNITLQLRKGEIHALLGENGAGKSTLMSILFGLYQPTSGTIKKNGQVVQINTPNDANDLNIGMVHQHFKLVECFSVLDNIILGVEPSKGLFLEKDGARKKVLELSERYGHKVEPDALISDITVGMQQRVEILKMLYRDNEVLIFDEPTAVLTPQEIEELMKIMKNLAHEGKSILFITHKLNEIMEVADRCTILRKGKYIGTVDIADTTKEELSKMMVGRNVSFTVDKDEKEPGDTVLEVSHLTVASRSHENNAVRDVSFQVRRGEIVCIAGIDGNGQTELVQGLTAGDTVLFLLSGGGSALFEQPLVSGAELQEITSQLLASGADIVEMNTIRKRLSGVKGGRFAQRCAPAQVFSIVLSDILGDPLDMIASGPAVPDTSTCAQALAVAEKYHLALSAQARALLAQETPKTLDNVTTRITGSVRELCRAAASACRNLGYEPVLLTDQLCCEAREAGSFLGSIVRTQAGQGKKLAYIAGGETIVHLTGKGLGGRNQELALAAAPAIAGLNAAVFSVGSDGTDGPTDAAGGYVDGDTLAALEAGGWSGYVALQNNDSYHALKAVDGLIITGATGTNVNDVAVTLIGEKHRL